MSTEEGASKVTHDNEDTNVTGGRHTTSSSMSRSSQVARSTNTSEKTNVTGRGTRSMSGQGLTNVSTSDENNYCRNTEGLLIAVGSGTGRRKRHASTARTTIQTGNNSTNPDYEMEMIRSRAPMLGATEKELAKAFRKKLITEAHKKEQRKLIKEKSLIQEAVRRLTLQKQKEQSSSHPEKKDFCDSKRDSSD